MKHLWIDLDGVVVNLVDRLAEVHGVEARYPTWPATYDLRVPLGKTKDEIWEHPSVRGSEFWATLPKHDWADDLVAMLVREFGVDRVSFLSQTVNDPWCAAGKLRWVAEHFPDIPALVGHDKHLVGAPGHVLLDDYEENERLWRGRGGVAVLFPAPWNRLRGHPDPVGLVERQIRERRREAED